MMMSMTEKTHAHTQLLLLLEIWQASFLFTTNNYFLYTFFFQAIKNNFFHIYTHFAVCSHTNAILYIATCDIIIAHHYREAAGN